MLRLPELISQINEPLTARYISFKILRNESFSAPFFVRTIWGAGMADDSVALYRTRAEHIRKLAEAAEHQSLRDAYLAIAEAWANMAERAGEISNSPQMSN
jgi:hypothetical protein